MLKHMRSLMLLSIVVTMISSAIAICKSTAEMEESVAWQKQIYDYGRGSKYNKPPIKALATSRLNKQISILTEKCQDDHGVLSFDENYLSWGCCVMNSSRPCLYPGYPYSHDPGGCVAKVGAIAICSIP